MRGIAYLNLNSRDRISAETVSKAFKQIGFEMLLNSSFNGKDVTNDNTRYAHSHFYCGIILAWGTICLKGSIFEEDFSSCTAGLGKTTLAHVVASHCGYRPVEINASDDRSGGALHTRITDACQMQAVLGTKQPNCVIIDEIDGAIGESHGS